MYLFVRCILVINISSILEKGEKDERDRFRFKIIYGFFVLLFFINL